MHQQDRRFTVEASCESVKSLSEVYPTTSIVNCWYLLVVVALFSAVNCFTKILVTFEHSCFTQVPMNLQFDSFLTRFLCLATTTMIASSATTSPLLTASSSLLVPSLSTGALAASMASLTLTQAASAASFTSSTTSRTMMSRRNAPSSSVMPGMAFVPPPTGVAVPRTRSLSFLLASAGHHHETDNAPISKTGVAAQSSTLLSAVATKSGKEIPEELSQTKPLPPPDPLDSTLLEPSVMAPPLEEWVVGGDAGSGSSKSLRQHLELQDAAMTMAASLVLQPPASSLLPTFAHMKRPQVVGHRGALYDCLENTRQSFLRCAELGCEAVELDVFVLKCGTVIVFHGGGTDENPGDLSDYCVGQHTDGVSILDLTYEECKDLKFNAAFSEFPCPVDAIEAGQIPTLEEVLGDLKGTATNVKIELKGPGTVEPVLDLVERLEMVEQCSYSSFDHDRLKLLRQLRPQVDAVTGQHVYRTGALFCDVPADFIDRSLAAGASEVHLRYDTCTVGRVNAIHEAGMSSMAWLRGPVGMVNDVSTKYWDVGNEDESCYQALIDTGVQQLCVNRPDVLLGLLAKQKEVTTAVAAVAEAAATLTATATAIEPQPILNDEDFSSEAVAVGAAS